MAGRMLKLVQNIEVVASEQVQAKEGADDKDAERHGVAHVGGAGVPVAAEDHRLGQPVEVGLNSVLVL